MEKSFEFELKNTRNEGDVEKRKSLVTVAVTTYNHQMYIDEALKSIVSQTGDFDLEVVVGVDHSEDSTRAIVSQWEKDHPNVVRPIYHDKRVGGQSNYYSVLTRANGDYVAYLDGDDRMMPGKLHKQVKFLQSHRECSMVGHKVRNFRGSEVYYLSAWPKYRPELSGVNDLVRKGKSIPNGSVMFRRECVDVETHKRLHTGPFGDWLMHILVALKGDVGFLNQVLGEKRINDASVTGLLRSDPKRLWWTRSLKRSVLYNARSLGVSADAVERGLAMVDCQFALLYLRAGKINQFKRLIEASYQRRPNLNVRQFALFVARKRAPLIMTIMEIRGSLLGR